MSIPRPKGKKQKRERHVITELKMSSGRVITDPAEVRKALIADGFEIDDTGKIAVGPKLRPQ